jgi:hypothetical protein
MSTTKSTWTDLGLNAGRQGQKLQPTYLTTCTSSMQAQCDNAIYMRSLNEHRIARCHCHNQCYTAASTPYISSRAGYSVLLRYRGTVTRCDAVFSSTFVNYRKACEKLQLCFWLWKCNSIESPLTEQPDTRPFSWENLGMTLTRMRQTNCFASFSVWQRLMSSGQNLVSSESARFKVRLILKGLSNFFL